MTISSCGGSGRAPRRSSSTGSSRVSLWRGRAGSVDISGSNTALLQITAEAFGLPIERVALSNADSTSAPHSPMSGGSKITLVVGAAISEACADAREQVFDIAAGQLEAAPEDLELVLEPNSHPAASAYQSALLKDGIPVTAFESKDIHQEVARLKEKGVKFTMGPMEAGEVTIALFSDTCGNLIQMYQPKG